MNTVMTMKMKFKKNQKGLTLIELLAVIVILGIIAAIAVPAIGGIISSTKDNADAQTDIMIKDAVVLKLLAEDEDTVAAATTPVTGTIAEVQGAGYLSKTPVWNTAANASTGYSASFTGGVWEVNLTD